MGHDPFPTGEETEAQGREWLLQATMDPGLSELPLPSGPAWTVLLPSGPWGILPPYPSPPRPPPSLSGQLGSAGSAAAGAYWKQWGPLISLSPGSRVSSFYRPHKPSLVAIAAHGSAGWPVPLQARTTSFFLNELIFQTHKTTRNVMGGLCPTDNYRVTLSPLRWCGGGRLPLQRP